MTVRRHISATCHRLHLLSSTELTPYLCRRRWPLHSVSLGGLTAEHDRTHH